MAAPTTAACVKKALANPEPSTHGPEPEATLAAGGVRCLWSTCRRSVGPNSPLVTRSMHRAEAFQIEAQAGPGSGIPPAKMSQRVSLSDGEGLLPSLCSDEPRAERTDQRVRQPSTHRVRDFVFARFAERPFWALLASGQINMRKVDGWQTLATTTIDQPIDLAA